MYLVTGASGFVGQALCRELDARGVPYRAVSRSSGVGYEGIGAFDAHTDWSCHLDGISCVIHLAARVHVFDNAHGDQLAAYRATNVDSTLKLARQSAERGVQRFIFVSSIKVNGESTELGKPFRADSRPDPRDPYGISKLEAEEALLRLSSDKAMQTTVIRPPLVYGPGVKANFRTMLNWMNRGLPLPLGAVDNRRSLISTGNLVDLIVLAAAHPAAANRVFLASDGEDISTTQLLETIAEGLGRRSRLVPVPHGVLNAMASLVGQQGVARRLLGSLQVDSSQTRSLLSWTPPLTLSEGLHLTARAYLDETAGGAKTGSLN